MILDKLENLKNYQEVNANFKAVVDFIKKNDLMGLELGKAPINENVYYNRQEYIGKEKVDDKYESHIDYIDIQIVLKGKERHLYSKDAPLEQEINAKDCYFTNAKEDATIDLEEGNFVIFFAGELHKPGLKLDDNKVQKIVFKVKQK